MTKTKTRTTAKTVWDGLTIDTRLALRAALTTQRAGLVDAWVTAYQHDVTYAMDVYAEGMRAANDAAIELGLGAVCYE